MLVRGLNALAVTVSTPLGAPVIAATRLRGGSAGSSRGAASFATQAVGTARLIVRRVRDLSHKAGQGQDELFPVWRYHAVFTDSPFTLIQAQEQHRDHAQVEQVLADWTTPRWLTCHID